MMRLYPIRCGAAINSTILIEIEIYLLFFCPHFEQVDQLGSEVFPLAVLVVLEERGDARLEYFGLLLLRPIRLEKRVKHFDDIVQKLLARLGPHFLVVPSQIYANRQQNLNHLVEKIFLKCRRRT